MQAGTDELACLVGLSKLPGVGPQRLEALVRRFGTAARVLGASRAELLSVAGIGAQVAASVREAGAGSVRDEGERALRALERIGALPITRGDPRYPPRIAELVDAPLLLHACGDVAFARAPAVAVVGTREPTPHGRRAALELADGLARAGYVVVSGMARGIDALAHSAALRCGGATVGVLGSGIDQVYPNGNRRLFEAVRASGLLLTEFPPGELPRAGNFPRRNRLITALAYAVVVVEMGLQSGAQHTVNFALEQGREVLAVPGPYGAPASLGTNQLIRDGAHVVTSVQDVLDVLEGVGAPVPPAAPTPPAPAPGAARGSRPAAEGPGLVVLDAIGDSSRHVDELTRATGLPVPALLSTLLELELTGTVEALPGKWYRRA